MVTCGSGYYVIPCLHFISVFFIFRYLLEYMWREQVRRSGADLFKSFLELIAERQREISPPEELPEVYGCVMIMELLYQMLVFSSSWS